MHPTAAPSVSPSSTRARSFARSAALTLVLGALLAGAVESSTGALASTGSSATLQAPGSAAATLEQCVTSVAQSERSATFMGEMSALAGTARMAMRIDVQERAAGDAEYRTLSTPGLGVWRSSDPKVKVYRYLRQVTNLSAPGAYRALVRYRWIGAKGRVTRRDERLTPRCGQPATPPQAQTPAPAGTQAPTQQPAATAGA